MPISWGISCCVEYCSTRGKCCMKQRSMLLNYQQGGFLAEKGSVVLLYSKITQERSALFWQIETALSRKWKKKKKKIFFSLISKPKAFSPAEAALPGFRHRLTSVVPGASLPCALGLVRLQHMLQQQRDALQGKYSPGESLGTSTEGKRMTFQTSYSLSVRVTGAVKHPPAGFRAAGPGPSSHHSPQGFTPVCFCGRAIKVPVSIFFSQWPFMKLYYSPVSIHIIFSL